MVMLQPMIPSKYCMAFTTGGLFRYESIKLVKLYKSLGDWNAVYEEAIINNILQVRTLNTMKRVLREVISRLKTLSSEELDFLVQSQHQEQGYLLWVSVCRRYKFIAEFAGEVLRERYLSFYADLNYEEFDFFFNRKAEWHPELDRICFSTKKKLRQVVFRMLREADLLTESNMIIAALLSPGLIALIANYNYRDLLLFPIFESDLKVLAS